jgi:UDP-N-acetylmuramoyl-L-alanyl-D-glutamate--2,6-diaminopimelate ligase
MTPILSRGKDGPILIKEGMKLSQLRRGIEVRKASVPADAEVTSLAYDSRAVYEGTLFFALSGAKAEGIDFVDEAIRRGAIGVVSTARDPRTNDAAEIPAKISWLQVADARQALAIAAANFYGHPADSLKLVAITGTNGKTTTSYLVDSILHAAGKESGLLGTVGYRTPRAIRNAKNTTPESLDLQGMLAEVRDAGGTHVTLEASSHSLMMDRLWGCRFDVAIFMNLCRDHLDYHHTLEEYFAAKRRLFEGTGAGKPRVAVLNTDDPHGRELTGIADLTLSFGVENGSGHAADITAGKFSLSFRGIEFTAQTPAGRLGVKSHLVGRINVYNILAAIGAGVALGISIGDIERGIAALERVPGRFESIDESQPFLVIVDYAHTDDAIRNLIATARELNPGGRVITLFGAGGDRDRTKRPLMGEAAGSASDLVILTTDNPRTEDLLRIMNDVTVGLQKAEGRYLIELDRRRAIELAMEEARPGDMVLLAGKGHENYQILRDRTFEFDDREVARCVLHGLGYTRSAKRR